MKVLKFIFHTKIENYNTNLIDIEIYNTVKKKNLNLRLTCYIL